MPEYTIPLLVPKISGNEWQYIKECLDTEWVSSAGKYVDEFENKIADYTDTRYAVSCVNGTSALQLSLRLAGVMPGDEVIVPTLTFIAPVNAIAYNGAIPVFMDTDEYYNIDTEKTIDFIQNETQFSEIGSQFTVNRKTGKRIAAIIPVHVWGNAARLDELISLCEERGIAVVEDASESLGTFYKDGRFKGKHTGTIGKLGCLSFNGNKIITTGGGGMILTDDVNLAEKARYLTTQAKDDSVRYIHHEIGYNFRLTNIQAALGVAQLEQLSRFLKRKKEIYQQYVKAVEQIKGLVMAAVPNYADNNHWMNVLQIDVATYGSDREGLMQRLEENGIQARPVWGLNHLQKPYQDSQTYRIEYAGKQVEMSICIPSSVNLKNNCIENIIEIIEKEKK
jgi:aminotransferase in exopolysaccharide biosynthesis